MKKKEKTLSIQQKLQIIRTLSVILSVVKPRDESILQEEVAKKLIELVKSI